VSGELEKLERLGSVGLRRGSRVEGKAVLWMWAAVATRARGEL
jgi:hypothetical protein